MPPNPLARLRTICLALPEAHEVEAWGEATFRVRNKLFAMYASAASHHGGGRPAVWVKAAAGNQSLMLQFAPQRFFVPPYVGPSGWVGVWLDSVVQWAELEELLRDAYRLTAPKRVAAQLDAPPPASGARAPGEGTSRGDATNAAEKRRPKKAGAKRGAKKPTAKRGAKKSTPKQGAKRSTPRHGAKEPAPQQGAKRSTPRHGARKTAPKRGAKQRSARKRRG